MSHNKRLEIKPSTQEHFMEFYEMETMPFTAHSLSFFLDGDLVALGGVRIGKDGFLAFSEIKPGVTVEKATIYRCGLEVMKMIKKLNIPVVAIPADQCTAPNFLKHLGFKTDEKGEVFVHG